MITCRPGRVALITGLLAVAACSGEQQDWRSAEAAGTAEAYSRFMAQHPDSELAVKAREHVAQLEEERDWDRAGKAGTVAAYREFLAAHSHGRWSPEARIRIESYALGSMPRSGPPRSAQPDSRPAGVRLLELSSAAATAPTAEGAAPATAYRPAAPADAAPARTTAGRYAVQLGAFGTEASAGREWQRLQARFGTQLAGLTPRIVNAGGASGPLYRLQAGSAAEAQARSICDTLRRESQACVPVPPH